MSRSEHEATRVVRLWLEEGVTALPDRVLDVVLDQLPATPQRRPSWLARRSYLMSNTARIALAAAAVVVVALIGYQLLIAPNVGGPGPSPSTSPTQAQAPSPAATPAAIFPPAGPLAVGRHAVNGTVPYSIEFTTTGWTSNGQWGIDKGGLDTAESAGFTFWPESAPDNVFGDPCAETLLSPQPGPSAAELASAVSNIPGISLVSGPSEVTVGGHAAQLVVFTVPDGIGCAPNEFYLWEDLDTQGASRYVTALGETFSVWIIDVDGTVVWIDAETFAASGPEVEQEVQEIVNSIQFE